MSEQKEVFIEKRKGPDAVIKAVWWVVGISWALIIAAITFTDQAKPRSESFFDRLFHVKVRDYWDEYLLRYAFYLFVLNLTVCIIGFVLNMLRHKRKTDRISKSIIVLGVINLAGSLWYLFR